MTVDPTNLIRSAESLPGLERAATAAGCFSGDPFRRTRDPLWGAVEERRNALSPSRRRRVESGAKARPTDQVSYAWPQASLWKAQDVPELWMTLRFGTRALRLLTLVCQRQHEAALVYRTIIGPVATYQQRTEARKNLRGQLVAQVERDDNYNEFAYSDDDGALSYDWSHPGLRLAVVLNEEFGNATFYPQCRCRMTRISVSQVRGHLATGKRRVVVDA